MQPMVGVTLYTAQVLLLLYIQLSSYLSHGTNDVFASKSTFSSFPSRQVEPFETAAFQDLQLDGLRFPATRNPS